MTYTVNAVKTISNRDYAPGYSCNLLRDGKKVAEIYESGYGDEVSIDWLDRAGNKVPTRTRRYDDTIYEYSGSPEEALFNEYIFNLPQIDSRVTGGKTYTNAHIEIDAMVNNVLISKKIASDMKKKVFILSNNTVLEFKVKAPQTIDGTIKLINNTPKYKGSVILNTMAIPDVMKIYQERNLI